MLCSNLLKKNISMHHINSTIILLISLILTSTALLAAPRVYTSDNKTIQKLYHRLDAKPTPMPVRLNQISRYFLHAPYQDNALGEGPDAKYDQGPLYRSDKFDCETYIDTVIAIALAPHFDAFIQAIKHIRYQNGEVAFITRNHFTSIDWNKNNQKTGVFQDITESILDKNNLPAAKISTTLINKPNWYAQLSEARIRLPNASSEERAHKHQMLRREGKILAAETAHLPYIPLTALFNPEGEPNLVLFNQIPDGAIIEIVRPNWDLEDKIGTQLDVSHMGFVFIENNALRFRHASTMKKKVSDVSLIEYLKNARNSPTIRGINIQVVLPNTARADIAAH
jgi:hypothetical protein